MTRQRTSREWLSPAWLAPVLLGAAGFYAAFVARSAFSFEGRTYFALFDDSMISMRYARNLAEGHGLVWNPGERVEGYSNFLWTLWMSVVHVAGVPAPHASLVVMLSAGALLVATLPVVRGLCAAVLPGDRLAGALAMVLTAFFYPLAFWALRGTEVALAAFLVALAALLALQLSSRWSARRCWALAGVLGAAVLTRDDLLVPAVVVIAWLAWQLPPATRRRGVAIAAGTVAAVLVGHVALRLAYYGDALPNTYHLKLGGIPLGERLVTGGESLLYTCLYSLSAPLLLAVVAVWSRRRSPAVLLLAALFVAQCAYSVYVGGDAWEDVRFANRYFAAVAPVLMVLAAVGIRDAMTRAVARRTAAAFAVFGALLLALRIADWVPHRRLGIADESATQLAPGLLLLGCAAVVLVPRVRRAPAALALALLTLAATSADPGAAWVRSNGQDVQLERIWTTIGVLVGRHTAPTTRVAMVTVGNLGYFSGRPAVDLLGKTDPVVAREAPTQLVPVRYRPGHNKWDYGRSIGALRPEVVESLWLPTGRDLCDLRRWGYEQVAGGLYVLRGARGVDRAGLASSLRPFLGAPGPAPTGCS